LDDPGVTVLGVRAGAGDVERAGAGDGKRGQPAAAPSGLAATR
jgi:hypothetical protein